MSEKYKTIDMSKVDDIKELVGEVLSFASKAILEKYKIEIKGSYGGIREADKDDVVDLMVQGIVEGCFVEKREEKNEL